jgi:ABC-type sugar transport system ATPase subunit
MKVRLEQVAFAYRRGPAVLSGISLELQEGGITVVIGPSGSGKSTLLQLLAGLLHPDGGAIFFDGRDVAGVPTERRDVGVVFQSYALFPHLTVSENIAFGLRTSHFRRRASSLLSSSSSRSRIEERVWDTAALLGIERLLDRRPVELSGGEQQRVAVARAVAPRPSLLLLDEPLSALDARLRRGVRGELASLLRRLGTTTLYVTHDQEEAMLLADHLVVLNGGRVVQEGPPLDLYRCPASPFIASFLGEANLLEVTAAEMADGARPAFDTPLGRLPCPPRANLSATATDKVELRGRLLVRPEDFTLGAVGDVTGVLARVVAARGLGPYDLVVLRFEDGTEVFAHLPPETAPPAGSKVRVAVRSGRPHFLPDPL